MNAKRVRPAFADTQVADVLRLLQEAKARGQGVRKADLLYEHHYSQAAARIHELEKLGYVIRHETEPGQRYVTYFLEREPDVAPNPSVKTQVQEPVQGTFPLCAVLERQP